MMRVSLSEKQDVMIVMSLARQNVRKDVNLLDIVGPIMVGPSSSHTAGAARIGNVCRRLLGEKVRNADIFLHGSFLSTGRGHGTDKAIVAGLLGLAVDDMNIPHSFEMAKDQNMTFSISGIDLGDVNPNSVKMRLTGVTGKKLEVVAASIGGGRIQVCELDGIAVNFSGEYPTLVVYILDQPGRVTEITSMLGHKSINIATMQSYRTSRGGKAVVVLECDQEVPEEDVEWLGQLEGVLKASYLSMLDHKL